MSRSALIVEARPIGPRAGRYNGSMRQDLPGTDLVDTGLDDLSHRTESVESLLVSIGAPRLRQLGIDVPSPFAQPEHRLYELLSRSRGDTAHSQYNALIRRLVSFERALACVR